MRTTTQNSPQRDFFTFFHTQENSSAFINSHIGSALACCMAGPSSNPGSAPPGCFSFRANKQRRQRREASANGDGLINVLYECGYECMKKTAATQAFINSCTQSFLQCAFLSSEKAHVRIEYAFCVFFLLLFPPLMQCVCGGGWQRTKWKKIEQKKQNGVHIVS